MHKKLSLKIHFTIRWLCLCFGLNISGAACSETILKYSNNEFAHSELVVPATVFHDWLPAEIEAKKVISSWKTEPITLAWTRIQLDRYVKHKMMPTRGARGLALTHVAMHDAYDQAVARGQNPKLVVSMAIAQVLGYLFVAEEKAFDRLAFAIAAELSKSKPDALSNEVQNALALGKSIGEQVVKYGDADGAQKGWNGLRLQYYGEGRYYAPGTWEPTPPYFYYPPDEPFAPSWKLWVLNSASDFRPTPPSYGSPRYVQDLEEVLKIQENLNDDERKIARFWVDGHGSVTPSGHWNQIAIDEVLKAKLGERATIRLFAFMNIAMADTFIAVWDAKYHYWTARPVTAAKYMFAKDFKPLLLTPPFPSYVSGHAGFSGAAAQILGSYLPHRANEMRVMAEEAANSRLLAGIHFRHDNEDGILLGQKVAGRVIDKFSAFTAEKP